MDCRRLERHIDAYLEGTTRSGESRRIREHLRDCPACRRLESLLRGGPELPGRVAPADLLDDVLAKTGSSPCARAAGLLPARADGDLAAVDGELVAMHLETCRDCSALAGAIERLAPLLPTLAQVEPGDSFLGQVLARTTRRETARSRVEARWRQAWERLWRRPRLALEGAYVGMLLMVVLFGTPLSPFQEVPASAVAAIRAGFSEPVLQPALVEIDRTISDQGGAAWSAARGAVTDTVGKARQEFGTRLLEVERTVSRTRDQGTRVGRLVLRGKIAEAWREVRDDGPDDTPAETTSSDRNDRVK